MKKSEPSAALFWGRFIEEQDNLRDLVLGGSASEAHQRIGELLADAGCSHVHEITCDDEYAHLIFSPESDPAVAKVVDRFVAGAPPIKGWKIFNRRQRKHLADAVVMLEHVYDVDAQDLRFTLEPVSDGFDVTMHTALDEILGDAEREGFVAFFLEHALGEDVAMQLIRKKRVAPLENLQSTMDPPTFVATILDAASNAARS